MSESFAELFEESFASQHIKPGSIITGKVVGINDDVVIVSAGLKSEAVIPIDQFRGDLREGEINIGDEVEVKVLKFDREKMRVSLGLKQMGDDPWENITRRYPEGTRLFGKVTNIADDDEIRVVTTDKFTVINGHPHFDTQYATIKAKPAADEYIKHTYREGWEL